MNNKKILFVSHDDSFTGAPILLLNLIRLINSTENYQTNVIVKNCSGKLYDEFASVSATYIINDYRSNFVFDKIKRIVFRIINKRFSKQSKIQKLINETDFLFINTITLGDLFNNYKIPSNVLTYTYVHELESVWSNYDIKSIEHLFKESNRILFPSIAVKKLILSEFDWTSSKLLPLNYFFNHTIGDFRTRSNKAFLKIGMIGTFDLRKGADLLPLIVLKLVELIGAAKFEFRWKGVNKNLELYKYVKSDLAKIGLLGNVVFLNHDHTTKLFYSDIDVLILTSREDPYPLVVLEAASNGIPTILFDQSGGSPEFVSNDCGFVVPYLSIDDLTKAIAIYFNNNIMYEMHSKNAIKKVSKLHMDSNLILNQISSIFKND